jgi:hypothetical protein
MQVLMLMLMLYHFRLVIDPICLDFSTPLNVLCIN